MLGLLKKKQHRRLRAKKLRLPGKKLGFIVIGILLFLALFSYLVVYLPYTKIRAKGERVLVAGKEVKVAFAQNDIDLVDAKLKIVDSEFEGFKKEAGSVYWMRFIPFLGAYISDFKNSVEAGDHLIQAGEDIIVAIKPHADLIGFKKGEDASFSEKPAELRLQTAVLTLDQIVKDVDKIALDVDKARENIQKINPDRYPQSIGGKPLRATIRTYKDQFEGIATLFVDAKPFIKALPDMLGAKDEKTYLILFQNDKELRATGGFLTAYAVFNVNKGKFEVRRSDDIYTLDDSLKSHPKATREIATYHKGVSQLFIRDSNLSPDFIKSVQIFDSLYQTSSQRVDYDGIITVDTHVLVDALKVLGDTQVRGINFSAEIDKRCNCPQVIYKLLDEIDRPVGYIKEDRKGILGDMLFTLMQKALGFSPSKYWGKLSQDVIKNLDEKHILIYMKDPKTQKALEALNFAGRIKPYKGDYLHINDVNFAGAKSNLFVQQEVSSETTIKSDGTVERKIEITYKNPFKHSDCSLERGGLCLNATLRNWFRMYVPEGSTLVEFKGSEKKVQTYDELGKTVFEGFFGVPPQGKTSAFITYTLPFKVQNEKDYRLLIQKQPGTDMPVYVVTVNGKKIGDEALVTDKEFKIQ